jgi:hypothetical protein
MRFSSDTRPVWATLVLLAAIAIAASGCTRTKYRLQADRDAYDVIAERNCDLRWLADNYSIELDPRSRYFDAYDPDHSPMPLDDPGSHQYMHLVDGKKGWKKWHKNGDRIDLENPFWREALAEYAEIGEEGSVKLDVDSALRLAYVHSPTHQRQLETLYLSALDVTAERFRLDSQFFGGYDTLYNHNGSLVPAALTYDAGAGHFVVSPPVDVDGLEINRVTVGRPSAGNPALLARRRFATAGELLVGFANSFVFEFTGGDANLASSLANFSFIQPLLRGAGKDVALEDLTFDERRLLANLRAYSQFRQGFYTQVAIGENGVTGPQRGFSTTSLQSFSGGGGINGYLGLLRQSQEIRNSEDILNLQLRTRAQLEALYKNELIDLVQVDQFRQSVESQRSSLLISRNNRELDLDRYKTTTLGLPPDLQIELDNSLIQQFQLVPREATEIQDSVIALQGRVGKIADLLDLLGKIAALKNRLGTLPDDAEVATIRQLLTDFTRLAEAIGRQIEDVEADLARLGTAAPSSRRAMSNAEQALIELVRARLGQGSAELEQHFFRAETRLNELLAGLSAETTAATISENLVWLGELLRLADGCVAVQARVQHVEAEPAQVLTDAFQLIEPVRQLFDLARQDLVDMQQASAKREQTMTKDERESFREETAKLNKLFGEFEQSLGLETAALESHRAGLSEQTRNATARKLVSWVSDFRQLVERFVLVPAQARLESITVDPIQLDPQDAFHVALANRLDFMNGRAALVDQWRLMQVNADALQSVLNVTASGDIRTARNNPVSFRAPTGTVRMGLEFDAPFTRLLERNAYRESLINYQQSRRGFIQSRDGLHLGLRALLRNLEQLRENLEIQRRAVTIAIRRVDQTQLQLNPPRQPVQPGQRAPINPTLARDLLSAQQALLGSQNFFLTTWLSYHAAKMRLYRELGIMTLDPEGRWIEYPIGGSEGAGPAVGPDTEELPLPPIAPVGWGDVADHLRQQPVAPDSSWVQPAGYSDAIRRNPIRRLPPTANAPDTNGYNR